MIFMSDFQIFLETNPVASVNFTKISRGIVKIANFVDTMVYSSTTTRDVIASATMVVCLRSEWCSAVARG